MTATSPRRLRVLVESPLALLAATALLRSAAFAFGILNIDESDFVVFGVGLWRGLIPYRDLIEIKPPLGYLTYAVPELLPFSVLPTRILGVLWVFATALLLRAAARRWRGSEPAGWAAGWLYLLATLCEVPSFNSEIMMNLPTAAGLYCFVRAREQETAGWDFAAGLCLGCASLYRHQGAIGGVAVGLAVLMRGRTPWRSFAVLLAGSVVPWAATVAAYAALGALPAFVDCVFVRNLSYAGGTTGSAWVRAAESTALCVSATLLPWWVSVRAARSLRWDTVKLALVMLVGLTAAAVSAGGRFYEHYYLQFAPALALLGAPAAVALGKELPAAGLWLRRAVLVAAVVPAAVFLAYSYGRGLTGHYPVQDRRVVELSRFLRDNTAPNERLFIWGHFTPIYALAHRLPGTRYPNTSPMMGNFDPEQLPNGFRASDWRSERDVRAALEDLRGKKPAIVVDTATADIHRWSKVPLSDFPDLAGYIHDCYRAIGHPGGASVYRLDERLPGCGKGRG
jgi:hypothetical protein